MERITKRQVIETVKVAITNQELFFRSPRLLEMWLNGRINLPSIKIDDVETVKRLACELLAGDMLKNNLFLYGDRFTAVIREISQKLSCHVDISSDEDISVEELCDVFIAALEDRIGD